MTRTSEWVSVSSYFFHLKSLAARTWLLATRLLATRLWLLAARVALCHELLSSAPKARFDAGCYSKSKKNFAAAGRLRLPSARTSSSANSHQNAHEMILSRTLTRLDTFMHNYIKEW